MSKRLLIIGIALIVVGLTGVGVLLWALAPSAVSPYASDGERIYYTGTGTDGRAIPRSAAGMMGPGMMTGLACVDCHGQDGLGGTITMMYGTVEVPDIRYSVLTSRRAEDGVDIPAWTDADIRRAIVDGVEPDGQRLTAPMPQWDMTDAEVADVIDYLKELSGR